MINLLCLCYFKFEIKDDKDENVYSMTIDKTRESLNMF